MGKKSKKQKRKGSVSFTQEDNSSCSSLDFSNMSLNQTACSPEKLIVSSAESAGCDAYSRLLKFHFKYLVFLHPSVMKSKNILDLVIVEGEEKKVLCLVHPLDHIKKSCVVFPREPCFKDLEVVNLLPYIHKVRNAEEISISFCNEEDISSQNMKEIVSKLLCHKYIYVDLCVQWTFMHRSFMCTIKDIKAQCDIADLSLNETSLDSSAPEFFMVNHKTVIKLESETKHCENETLQQKTKHCENKTSAFSHIGGLEEQIFSVNRYIQLLIKSINCISSKFCGTLMLHGPPGTGKSLLLDALSKEYDISENGHIVWHKIYSMRESEIEKQLNFVFQKAVERAPSLIIIDDFNHLCPSKKKAKSIELHVSKILSQLIARLDDAKIIIIAATNDSDYDETVLQTSKRLMEVIEFQIPSSDEREDILQKLLATEKHELTFEQIKECSQMAHGYTGKDLLSVTKYAKLLLLSRSLKNNDYDDRGIKYEDLKRIIKLRKPTIVGSDIQMKKVKWSDIGGMTDVKKKLKMLVEWPLKYPKVFAHFHKTPVRGILMFGPPGCSKTMLAQALATECDMNFISKNVSDLINMYVGESEKLVRDLFSLAKSKAPCIIFLDEIDAIGSERGSSCGDSGVGDRVVTTLLTEINGIEELHGVIIIAATNRPDVLDNALIRSGRISKYIYVPLPDAEAREEILKIGMRNRLVADDIDFKFLSAKTGGYTGAEIVNMCDEAARQLLFEDPCADSPTFRLHHFEDALFCNPPRTDQKLIECCERFLSKGL